MKDEYKEWIDMFDLQFGKRGPNGNCDSIGRRAGCDDCIGNILLREEHKDFLLRILKLEGERIEKLMWQDFK